MPRCRGRPASGFSARRNAARGRKTDQRVRCRNKGSSLPEVRVLQDLEGLLEGLDLLVATSRALLPGHAAVHAHGLELLQLVQRGLQQLLLRLEVGLRLGDVELGVRLVGLRRLLQRTLVRDIRLGVRLERVVLALGRRLRRLRGGDAAREVLLDLLEQRDDRLGRVRLAAVLARNAAGIRGHVIDGLAIRARVLRGETLVPLGGRRLLQEGRPRVVEAVEHLDRILDRSLAGRRIRDGLLVLGALFLAELRRLVQRLLQVGDLLGQLHDVLREAVHERVLLRVERVQVLDLALGRVALRGGLLHVLIAPALLVRLGLGLRLQARDEVLDHLLDFRERARRLADLDQEGAEDRALQGRGLPREEAQDLLPRRRVRLAVELQEAHRRVIRVVVRVVVGVIVRVLGVVGIGRGVRRIGLHLRSRGVRNPHPVAGLRLGLAHRRLLDREPETRRRVHLRHVALEHLERARDGRELLRAGGGALVPVLRLLLALLRQVVQEVLVRGVRVLRLLELRRVRVELLLQRGARGRLLRLGLLQRLDLVGARTRLHLVLLAGRLLIVVHLHLLLLEVLQQRLQRGDDLVRVVRVRVGRVRLLDQLEQLLPIVDEAHAVRQRDAVQDDMAILGNEPSVPGLRIRHLTLRRLHRLDRTLHRTDGLRELRSAGRVRLVLRRAGLIGGRLLPLQGLDVLLVLRDLLVELSLTRRLVLDLRLQDVLLLDELLDRVLLVVRLLLAEARELVVSRRLRLTLLLDLTLKLLEESDYLFDRVHTLLGLSTKCCAKQDELPHRVVPGYLCRWSPGRLEP